MKKIIIGSLALSALIFFGGMTMASASEEAKPHESMERFRGGDLKESAKDLEISKEDFFAYRDIEREAHRQERVGARQERLSAAVERGCITEEEMSERMQKRGGRFAK